jgi:hypothetical protein
VIAVQASKQASKQGRKKILALLLAMKRYDNAEAEATTAV